MDKIIIKGAREHNLKNISLDIPKNRLVVITGLSGSGKSSLAFDTLYAEGQRRYVESLSAYARQFLDRMDKPDVDSIEGLSPAISIEQKTASHNPRSTVGTVTEIYDYLRLLFARIGVPHCYKCQKPIASQSVDEIVSEILAIPNGERIVIMAPVVKGRKGEYKKLISGLLKEGFVRARVDGEMAELSEMVNLARFKAHTIDLIIDRIVLKEEIRTRIVDSVELALKKGDGLLIVHRLSNSEDLIFSQLLSCKNCGVSMPNMEPRLFSFNSPHGACQECTGLGVKMEIDPVKIIANQDLTIMEGAIIPWPIDGSFWYRELLKAVAEAYGFSLRISWKKLSDDAKRIILFGSEGSKIKYEISQNESHYRFSHAFEGVIPNLVRRYKETKSESVRTEIESYMTTSPCPSCWGKRLNPQALSVKLHDNTITEFTELSIDKVLYKFKNLPLSSQEQKIAHQIFKEIISRLEFLNNVGLSYLTLSRPANTLSGGESQRIRLATQIGSRLTGVLYVLDEPSIGLHQKDNQRLLKTLKEMRDIGNSVIVVEHDEETIREADHIIDLGIGAGIHGGSVVAQGNVDDIISNRDSITGDYLSGRKFIPVPSQRRKSKKSIVIEKASGNNLKSIDAKIPLGLFIVVTGVSGSGKSTLIMDTLYKGMALKLFDSTEPPSPFSEIKNWVLVDKIIKIDQSPIGRTPRSNPATYTGLFTPVRELFSNVPESRTRGYAPGRFSFNVRGGRCEACQGDGIIRIEMQFLPDVYITCEACRGKRYNRDTLEITYHGKTIADILDMTVSEALIFFDPIPAVKSKIQTLEDVGLGYIHLGQSATTLSGGEAQRIKLSRELSKRSTGRTLYVLDEPTTGLHFEDVRRLLEVLNRLVDWGNTVIVIEHNLDVIKNADYIIDLGPEGGDNGGNIIAEGTPEDVAMVERSYTGLFLKKVLYENNRSDKERKKCRLSHIA